MTDPTAGALHTAVRSLREAFGEALDCSVSLAAYSTYRVGGAAAALLQVHSIDDLLRAYAIISGSDVPTLVVGKGSNLVVADRGFPGLVLCLGDEFAFIDIDLERSTVTAGGAAFLPVVARQVTKAGLGEFTWAVGVPGSVGGAVRMNAGGHGSDMAATLVSATVFDLASGQLSRPSVNELGLGYRTSSIRATQLVLDATLQLMPGDRDAGERELSEIVRWRREHQPGGANGGSVFANPDGASAGALIDAAGGKGMRVGTASVSEKHANFIMADAGGSADDVFELILQVQSLVNASTGIVLKPENRLVGFDQSRLLH